MSKTLIGIVSYSGIAYLRLLLDEIERTATLPHDVLVVVAKPGDEQMKDMLRKRDDKLSFIIHERNWGFPASINDLYDAAFVTGDYDNLVCCGNDIVPMPGAIDAMIRTADETHYEMICGSEFNSRFLYDQYPEARQHFDGPNLIVKRSAFQSRVWELHKDFHQGVEPDTRKDIRNFTLFKRSSFEKVGYDDINFWPNGYFADNDYGRRCDLLNISAAGLKEGGFFHWWSRTIMEGEKRDHGGLFERNATYYTHKWGSGPRSEPYQTPFNSGPYRLGNIDVPCDMKISTRDHEAACVDYWEKL